MTQPGGSLGGPARRRRGGFPLAAGIAVALIADAVALGGMPTLVTAWTGPDAPATTPSRTPGKLPTATGGVPGSAKPTTLTPKPAASAAPTSGEVKVSDGIKRGIVLIDATLDASTQSSGTGMILDSSGQVLTNYHVVRSTSSVTVTVVASQRRYTATLIGRDAIHDVALLQLKDASGMPTITPDRDAVGVGDPVVAAGNAAGQGFLTAFAGRIVGLERSIRVRGASPTDPEENLAGLVETDAHAEPGDSGGPLFDAENEVLGMTTAGTSSGSQGSAYAVPIADALAVVSRIRAGDETNGIVVGPKAALGVNAVDDTGKGVRVTKVISGTAASRSGLRVDDYITSLAGQKVDSLATLMGALDTVQPGQTVTIAWTRGGTSDSSQVTLDTSKYN